MSYFWITILVIIALLVVYAVIYWSDIPNRRRHHHTWSPWSKPFKVNRIGYNGTDADQFYGTGEEVKYATYHQTRRCMECGVIKSQEISRTAYEGEK